MYIYIYIYIYINCIILYSTVVSICMYTVHHTCDIRLGVITVNCHCACRLRNTCARASPLLFTLS